jgi:hypothetical protein
MTPSLLLGLLLAVEPPPNWKVAAPDWQVEKVSPERAARYSSYLDAALRDQGFIVLSPGDTDAQLSREQQTQLRTCGSDAGCLGDIGRVLDVDAVLTGKLKGFPDGSVQAQLRLVSSATGRVVVRSEPSGRSDAEMMRALDEAALALEVGIEVERPVTRAPAATLSIRSRQIARGETGAGPPPALVPYQNSIPSLSIVDLDEPRNAWIPAATGGLFTFLGAQQVVQSTVRGATEARARQVGPVVEETEWLNRATRADPRRQERAGWAGVGIGIGAIVGSAIVFRWGEDSPLRVEPFAGPTGGGIGLTTRF